MVATVKRNDVAIAWENASRAEQIAAYTGLTISRNSGANTGATIDTTKAVIVALEGRLATMMSADKPNMQDILQLQGLIARLKDVISKSAEMAALDKETNKKIQQDEGTAQRA